MLEKKYIEQTGKVSIYEVTYASGPFQVKGCLAVPHQAEHCPGILYLRGGIKRVGMVQKDWIAELAHHGYAVFAPYYRGNEGGEGKEDFCGDDREDAYQAFDVLAALEETAGMPIHIVGFSRGGVMALFTGMERPAASIVCWSGVSDMFLTYEERPDLRRMLRRVTGGTPGNKTQAYHDRTPLSQLQNLKAPVLIMHGEEDEHVSIEHAVRLERRLHELGHPYTRWTYEGMPHRFPSPGKEQAAEEMMEWMEEQARKRESGQ